jgi:hypothetical protein
MMKDGLPLVSTMKEFREKILSAGDLAKKAGSAHLGYAFDAKPFISDLQKLSQAVLKSVKIWKQLSRDSDRIVRRKASFDPVETVTDVGGDSTNGSLGLPRADGQSINYQNIWKVMPPQQVTDFVWRQNSFSGAFTYHLSQAHSFLGKLDMYAEQANHLLGFEINLETLWNLTRWSWLIDWFVDVGGFLHNIDLLHSNSLVLRYGYVMTHIRASRVRTVNGLVPQTADNLWPFQAFCSHSTLQSTALIEWKTRRRATPYGFGLDVGSFSDAQWAILGALGLSKGPKALRHRE